MGIQTNSRLILGRYKDCTNAGNIATRSWVYGEFENVLSHLVQRAHKPWRTCKFIRHFQRRIVPWMEIQANSRLNFGRYKGCTNASNISTRSWGYGEFENVIPHSVHRAHKLWRACKYISHLQPRIVPSMEIQANSRRRLGVNFLWRHYTALKVTGKFAGQSRFVCFLYRKRDCISNCSYH